MHALPAPFVKLIPLLFLAISCACHADARSTTTAPVTAPASTAQDTTDLKFREFFKMPVGPRGLEPSEKLLGLAGKRVRILGYMAKQEQASADSLLLTPLPVTMGDADEGLADDLPPTTVFVHLTGANRGIPYIPGLIRLSGILSIGAQDEADGRVSTVRLMLDAAATGDFIHSLQGRQARK